MPQCACGETYSCFYRRLPPIRKHDKAALYQRLWPTKFNLFQLKMFTGSSDKKDLDICDCFNHLFLTKFL